jgi:hypothetical protein
MSKKYYTESISDETLAKMIDKTLKFEKNNKAKKAASVIFRIVPAAAMLALVIGLANILPAMLNINNDYEPGNAGSSGLYLPVPAAAEPTEPEIELPLGRRDVTERTFLIDSTENDDFAVKKYKYTDEYGQDYFHTVYRNILPALDNSDYTDESREAIKKEIQEHGIEIPIPQDGETLYVDITYELAGHVYRISEIRREGSNIYFEDNTVPKEFTKIEILSGDEWEDSYGAYFIYDRKKAAENNEIFIAHALYTIVTGTATQSIAQNINLQILSPEEYSALPYSYPALAPSPSNIDPFADTIIIVMREMQIIQY